jgi:hypothetical protein
MSDEALPQAEAGPDEHYSTQRACCDAAHGRVKEMGWGTCKIYPALLACIIPAPYDQITADCHSESRSARSTRSVSQTKPTLRQFLVH